MISHTHAILSEVFLLVKKSSPFLQGIGDIQVEISKSGISEFPCPGLLR